MENNKIPTSHEFLKREYFKRNITLVESISLVEVLKQFTKLHVQAALEAAAENAKVSNDSETIIRESVYTTDVYGVGEDWAVNKKSILEDYPLNQIV